MTATSAFNIFLPREPPSAATFVIVWAELLRICKRRTIATYMLDTVEMQRDHEFSSSRAHGSIE